MNFFKIFFKKNIFYISLLSIIFTACSTKQDYVKIEDNDIYKLVPKANDNFINQNKSTQYFFNRYFKPWEDSYTLSNKLSAMWGLSYQYRKIYLENHRLASKKWFKKQISNANFDKYNSFLKKAITIKNTNVRVLPTNQPMFYEPTKPGEGFPFDYNQNSLLKINTPLRVSHLSKDKAWVYIESFIVSGWVPINDIAFVDEYFMRRFKNGNYYVSVKEKFPIYSSYFREYVKLATIFPREFNSFLIASSDMNKNALLTKINLQENYIAKMPLKYNTANRVIIAKSLMDEPYGWGGLMNNRDCSSFTQDFFLPFGKFLSRNSKAQRKNGKYFDISNLSKKEKKDYIVKNAIPFSTLVYLRGHIMLYVGVKNNEPLVMHNMWSVRLKDEDGKEFRHIIGKTSITTLEPGKNLDGFDPVSSSILNKIQGIVIL